MNRKTKECKYCNVSVSLSNFKKHESACEKKKPRIQIEQYKKNETEYECPFCFKTYTARGIGYHIWKNHGDGKAFDPNAGYKNGNRIIWNKGETKETNDSVKKIGETLSSKIKTGEIVPYWTGHKHRIESRKKQSRTVISAIANGTFKTWSTQSRTSYPELYFENVLCELGVTFEKQYHVHNGSKNYYLDFLVESKLDLEIDGKQHVDRKEQDENRDAFVKSLGFSIFRIAWKNPNTKEGKKYLVEKIEKLKELLNK